VVLARFMTEPTSVEKSWRRFLGAAIVIGVILRILIYVETHWTILDGLIEFRFAEQFSLGHGLVFNAGERVSGNTSVLYSLILGMAGWCRLSIPLFSRFFGVGCDLLTVFLIQRILTSFSGLKSLEFRFGIPVVIFLFPLTFPYAVSGMETSLYVALIFLLIDQTLRKQGWMYFVAAGLLIFCRPDSIVFVAASLLFIALTRRRLPWKPTLIVFFIGVTYLGFNFVYYGSIVPNTLLAKSVAYHDSISVNFHHIASRFLKSDVTLALLLAAMISVFVWLRKTSLVLLLGIMSLSFFLFLLTVPQLRSWYVVPFLYLCLLLIAIGIGRLTVLRIPSLPRPFFFVVMAVYILGCGFSMNFLIKQFRDIRRYEEATRADPGQWLRENTPPDTKVFVTALEVGYYSKRYTYDYPGLVTPAVWKLLRTNPGIDLFGQAEAMKADYILIPDGGNPPPNFEFIRTFKCENPPPSFDLAYALYKRNDRNHQEN
jgi:hypothetical protein